MPSNPWTSNDDLALLGKLREAVAGSDFDASVFLGEGHKALGMIANAATRIYTAWKAARNLNWSKAAAALADARKGGFVPKAKTTAQGWLELQYGWLPLVKDAYAGAQFLGYSLNAPLQFTVNVSRKVKRDVNPLGNTRYQEATYVVRKRIKAILKERNVVALSGLTDPATLAWELLPYSFVIDWFLPIGQYLSARGLAQALDGTFITSTKSVCHVKNPYKYADVVVIFPNDFYYDRGSFDRAVTNSLVVPRPSFKSLGQAASWKHAANAVALLTQKAKRPDFTIPRARLFT